MFFRDPNLPSDFLTDNIAPLYNVDDIVKSMRYRMQRAFVETKTMIEKIKLRNKLQYDKNANTINVRVGDKIKVKNEPYDKFKFIYSGPFTVLEIDKENVVIDMNGKKYKIHKNRVVKY